MVSEKGKAGRTGRDRKLYLDDVAFSSLQAKAKRWGRSPSSVVNSLLRILAGTPNEFDDAIIIREMFSPTDSGIFSTASSGFHEEQFNNSKNDISQKVENMAEEIERLKSLFEAHLGSNMQLHGSTVIERPNGHSHFSTTKK